MVSAEMIRDGRSMISITSDVADQFDMPAGKQIADIDAILRPLYYVADKVLAIMSHDNSSINVEVRSDIPLGAGLGSSSACCVAAAAAILGATTAVMTKSEILDLAIDAERTIFADTSGADCTVCMYGGIVEYAGKDTFSRSGRLDSGLRLVVANSDTRHFTDQMAKAVEIYKRENEEEFSVLCDKELRLVEDVLDIIHNGGSAADLGKKFSLNQEYLKKIGVSNDTLDRLIRAVRGSSLGAKITGAGGGGCVFALVEDSCTDRVLEEFTDAGCKHCFAAKIDEDGLILYN